MKKSPLKYYQKKKQFDFNTEDYKSLDISQLKKQADYWLRQYLLRETESKYGKYYCPLKGQWFPANLMEVAHFIDRAYILGRYDLKNCHLISKQSNSYDAQVQKEGYKSLHHYDYQQFLIEKYGENIIKYLEDLKEYCIFDSEFYIDKIKKFRDE